METTTFQQDQGSTRSVLTLLAVVAVGLAILQRILSPKIDPREPPAIPSKIPVVGHLINLLRHGVDYYSTVYARYNYPVFTLPMPGSRVYVVTSPSLAGQVQKTSKTVSFEHIVVPISQNMVGLNAASRKILNDELGKEDSLMRYEHDMTYKTLGPGDDLDGMTRTMMDALTVRTAELLPSGAAALDCPDLFNFTRDIISLCSVRAFFGPNYPIVTDPSLLATFWEYEANMASIMFNFLPSLTARRGTAAREALCAASYDWLQRGDYRDASPLIRNRIANNRQRGFSESEVARAEVGILFAGLVNASNHTFWTVSQVFSRPDLLAQIRAEIEQNAVVVEGSRRTMSVTALRGRCPLLVSANREALRLASPLSGVRVAVADTEYGGYLFKKGSVILLPGSVMHRDPAVWGADVAEFNPRRFLNNVNGFFTGGGGGSGGEGKAERSVHAAAFRSFGGGAVFCPGRHFAQLEVLGLAALLFAGFEVGHGGDAQETMRVSGCAQQKMPLAVDKPDGPVRVTVKRRKGLEEVDWVLTL